MWGVRERQGHQRTERVSMYNWNKLQSWVCIERKDSLFKNVSLSRHSSDFRENNICSKWQNTHFLRIYRVQILQPKEWRVLKLGKNQITPGEIWKTAYCCVIHTAGWYIKSYRGGRAVCKEYKVAECELSQKDMTQYRLRQESISLSAVLCFHRP